MPAALLVVLSLAACRPEPPAPPMAPSAAPLPDNPLPPCRYPTNCVRVSQAFRLDPDTLFARVQAAVGALGPAELRSRPDERRLDAVDRVFVFKDDLAAIVRPHADGAVLHVRSASRVGRGDFGVNRRRVLRLLRHLDAAG